MNYNFILDEDYLAFLILCREMTNESKAIKNIKEVLSKDIGFQKITGCEILDINIYLSDSKIKELINTFISSPKFNEIYKLYKNETKESVAIKLLIKPNLDDEELNNIKNKLYILYMEAYDDLLRINEENPTYYLMDDDVKRIVQVFKGTAAFKELYEETQSYLEYLKANWEKNKEFVNDYLRRILKIKFDRNIPIYITHPNTGICCSNGNSVIWGTYKDLQNPKHAITYLVHEGLHCLLPYHKEELPKEKNIKHTIIEFISDYELYSMLKGESTLIEGHLSLNEYKSYIYPYWLKYIGLNKEEIMRRLEKDSIPFNKLTEIENIDISNLNIVEFIEFCNKKYYLKDQETRITK